MMENGRYRSDVDELDRGGGGLRQLSKALSQKANNGSLAGQALAEMRAFFLDSKLNVLLLALPFAFFSRYLHWAEAATFVLSCLALTPLAERLGFVTEQLAMYTNDTIGGLLNATFGNATEVIISAFALVRGGTTYLRIVQLTLLGSVVSNLLLVMGSAFVCGGIKQKTQSFSQQGINVNCGMLVLATFAVMLASLLHATHTERTDSKSELSLSRFMSIFMIICYGVYLYFQLKTHRHLFEEGSDDDEKAPTPSGAAGAATPPLPSEFGAPSSLPRVSINGSAAGPLDNDIEAPVGGFARKSLDGDSDGQDSPHINYTSSTKGSLLEMSLVRGNSKKLLNTERQPLVAAAVGSSGINKGRDPREGRTASGRSVGSRDKKSDDDGLAAHGAEDDDDEEELILSKIGCFVWLTIVTVFISFLSEFITDAIQNASKGLGIPLPFLTTILLPIVGNAAEHASALVFAYKNRIEIALGVAVGSSTQISMMVVPFTVLLAWVLGQPLDLDFNAFEAFVLFGSVLLAVIVVQDGQSNYLKGLMLILTYIFISAGFWCHKDTNLISAD